ncbi:MAG: acyl-CoA thioesterase [Lysobacteraceae bacterium]|nr:MAG: acyl-CoA thioesterase [Xanthomonadaceae bacterium]
MSAVADSQVREAIFKTRIDVRWGDMDAFNHVNNAQYLRYLEEARIQWLSQAGVSITGGTGPVLAASTLNYRQPIGWPNQLLAELFVNRIGNSSMTIGHRLLSSTEPAVLHCDGHVVIVWIDTATGKSVSLPEDLRRAVA